MGGRVLVTRPEPAASATARRLEAAGFSPIVLPLSRTQPLAVDATALPDHIDAVAVTSANAVRHASAELTAALSARRCFAVGRKTAKAAREAGFRLVTEGPGDAVGLAAMIAAELPVGARIAYLTGRVRLPDFERRLTEAGYRPHVVETYDTCLADQSAETLSVLPKDGSVDAVLLYSAKAAEAFSALAKGDSRLTSTRCLCLSGRVADALQGAQTDRIFVADEPSEEALVALLTAVCGTAS
ncbi:uroporphyrinogen-III synthase [Mesorhizobium sp. KR1-2]|uniref:uroporphyrinogen-III synthase n=1 Tax=Mesorhizobium sp. KR1-2 TaxID=3156609 RepID=UPI0032B4CF32